MAQGFIKGLRLGRTSEMRLVCADVAVSRCGTFSKVVDIISISENPRTFVTYIYFEIPENMPPGLYDVLLTTPAGIVKGSWELGDGLQFIGDATISGFVVTGSLHTGANAVGLDHSGISSEYFTVSGTELMAPKPGFGGTKFYFGGLEVAPLSEGFNPPYYDMAMLPIPGHSTLTGISSEYRDYYKSGIVSFDISASNDTGNFHTGDGKLNVIPPPQIYGFGPESGTEGTLVSVTGANFVDVSLLSLGGQFISQEAGFNTMGFTGFAGGYTGITIGATYETGFISFIVPNLSASYPIVLFASGGEARTNDSEWIDAGSQEFYFINPPVEISGFTPTRTQRNKRVEMSGWRLGTTDILEFSGEAGQIQLTDFDVVDFGLGKIEFTVPPLTVDGQIKAINEGGFAVSAETLEMILPPTLSGMSKTIGTYKEPNSISGLHLTGSSVLFWGVSGSHHRLADNITYDGDSIINFTTPREISRGYTVKIITEDGDTEFFTNDQFTPFATVSGWNNLVAYGDDNYLVRMGANSVVITGVNATSENVTHIILSGDNQAMGWSVDKLISEGNFVREELIVGQTGNTIYSGILSYDTGAGFFGTGKLAFHYDNLQVNENLDTGYFARDAIKDPGSLDKRFENDIFESGGYLSGGLFAMEWHNDPSLNRPIIREFRAPFPTIFSFSPDYAYAEYSAGALDENVSTLVEIQGTSLHSSVTIEISGFDSYPNTLFPKCKEEDNCGHVFEVLDDQNIRFYVPGNFSGSGHLLTHNAVGEIATSTGILRNVRPITILDLAPEDGSVPYGTFTIRGDNLDHIKSVKFGDFVVSGYETDRIGPHA